jgi:hypothetical protein
MCHRQLRACAQHAPLPFLPPHTPRACAGLGGWMGEPWLPTQLGLRASHHANHAPCCTRPNARTSHSSHSFSLPRWLPLPRQIRAPSGPPPPCCFFTRSYRASQRPFHAGSTVTACCSAFPACIHSCQHADPAEPLHEGRRRACWRRTPPGTRPAFAPCQPALSCAARAGPRACSGAYTRIRGGLTDAIAPAGNPVGRSPAVGLPRRAADLAAAACARLAAAPRPRARSRAPGRHRIVTSSGNPCPSTR